MMTKIKTRHSEYMYSILYSKCHLKVDKDYSPYLVNKALRPYWENHILELNMINRKGAQVLENDGNVLEQRLHEKQMHYDFLLHTIPKQKPKK